MSRNVEQVKTEITRTVADTEKQENYRLWNDVSDQFEMGTSAASLQYSSDYEVASLAREVTEMREQKAASFTREEVTGYTTNEYSTDGALEYGIVKNALLIIDKSTGEVITGYYNPDDRWCPNSILHIRRQMFPDSKKTALREQYWRAFSGAERDYLESLSMAPPHYNYTRRFEELRKYENLHPQISKELFEELMTTPIQYRRQIVK